MRSLWCVLFTLLFGFAAEIQGQTRESLMAARVQSHEAITQLLAEHNPALRGLIREAERPDVLRVYQRLLALAPRESSSQVAEQVAVVERQLQELEQLPPDRQAIVPAVLNPILAAHQQIDMLLGAQSDMVEVGSRQRIEQLNLAIARLGLLYQTRLFNGLLVPADNPERDVMAELDEQIMALFGQLAAGLDSQLLFQRSQRNYHFVRASLLGQQANWVPNAAQLYLSDAMQCLSELGGNLQ